LPLLIRGHQRARCQAEIPPAAPSEIVEPLLYKAKMLLKDADNWSMDGCTAAGVCASGVFTRVK